jgi:hypothetical protein
MVADLLIHKEGTKLFLGYTHTQFLTGFSGCSLQRVLSAIYAATE